MVITEDAVSSISMRFKRIETETDFREAWKALEEIQKHDPPEGTQQYEDMKHLINVGADYLCKNDPRDGTFPIPIDLVFGGVFKNVKNVKLIW
jgi:hypothetical protein